MTLEESSSLKVLVVVGSMRSGSTLLDLLLGSHPSVFSGGEIRAIWEDGYLRGQPCSCGEPPQSCEFWSEVMRQAFTSAGRPDPSPERVHAWQQESLRQRHTRAIVRATEADPSLVDHPDLSAYRDTLLRLYDATASVSGREWLVDSSKLGSDLALVAPDPSVDARAVHLTRDPRGVAYSWARAPRSDGPGWDFLVPRSTTESTLDWLRLNVSAGLAVRTLEPERAMRVLYEDLATEPARWLAAITEKLGIPTGGVPTSGSIDIGQRHLIGGNPVRFSQELTIRLDEEWVDGTPWLTNLLIGAACAPVSRRYGYPIFRRSNRRPR